VLEQQLGEDFFVISHRFDQPDTRLGVALIKRVEQLYPLYEASCVFELQSDVIAHGCREFDREQA
jgi:hypothetical protein